MSANVSRVAYQIDFSKLLVDHQTEFDMPVYKITWTDDTGKVCLIADWVGTRPEAVKFCENKLKALYRKFYRYEEGIRNE